jgi:hypothetical protein
MGNRNLVHYNRKFTISVFRYIRRFLYRVYREFAGHLVSLHYNRTFAASMFAIFELYCTFELWYLEHSYLIISNAMWIYQRDYQVQMTYCLRCLESSDTVKPVLAVTRFQRSLFVWGHFEVLPMLFKRYFNWFHRSPVERCQWPLITSPNCMLPLFSVAILYDHMILIGSLSKCHVVHITINRSIHTQVQYFQVQVWCNQSRLYDSNGNLSNC